ncbi:MAG: peptide/nickel transport system permease protein [Gammaproteobacteria bacterium]|jgi:peptide/nickel transport system permease protein|nr:peptide/nickel transport system permease protein [Gammaproteobacteria bacterium]
MSVNTPELAVLDERPERGHALRVAARQFVRNRAAVAGLACLVLICAVTVLAPVLAPYDPVKIHLASKLQPPSLLHWFGTDHFGRDVLSRVIYGGRVSLLVGLLVTAFTFVVGVPLGLASGFLGGRIDNIFMRLVDAFLTFPPLLLAVAIVGLLGADVQNVMLALGMVQAPILARLVRGSALSAREEVHVLAARALGAGPFRIAFSNVLRNILSPIIVQLTIVFAAAVVTEAALSFLGLGTQPPQPSWGRDISDARRFLADAPWMFLVPSTAIILCALSLHFMADGLRDWMDPRSRRR